jgi:hypothetical protein
MPPRVQGLKEVVTGPWTADQATNTRQRTYSYVRPLNIPLPFAPKQCK